MGAIPKACLTHRPCALVVGHWHCHRASACACFIHLSGICTSMAVVHGSLKQASLQACICRPFTVGCKAHCHACRRACMYPQSATRQLLPLRSHPHMEAGVCVPQPCVGGCSLMPPVLRGNTVCQKSLIVWCWAVQHAMQIPLGNLQLHASRRYCSPFRPSAL